MHTALDRPVAHFAANHYPDEDVEGYELAEIAEITALSRSGSGESFESPEKDTGTVNEGVMIYNL